MSHTPWLGIACALVCLTEESKVNNRLPDSAKVKVIDKTEIRVASPGNSLGQMTRDNGESSAYEQIPSSVLEE